MKSPDRSVHARATVRAVELRLATGAINDRQAAEQLDRLLYSWRGDNQERALRERLAELQARSGNWRVALGLLRDTEALFPIALEEGVAYIPGPAFSIGGRFTNALRLAFSAEAWDTFIEHIKRGQPGPA